MIQVPVNNATRSFGLSVAAHVLFFALAPFIWFGGMNEVVQKTEEFFRVRPVQEHGSSKAGSDVVKGYNKSLQFQNPNTAAPKYTTAQAIQDEAFELPSVTRPATQEKIRVVETSQRLQPKEQSIAKDEIVVERRKVQEEDVVEEIKFFDPGRTGIAVNTTGASIQIPEPFIEKMEAFTPQGVPQGQIGDFFTGIAGAGRGSGKGASEWGMGSAIEGIDEFMSVQATTWRDPSDNQGYFELVIYPGKDAARLASMPKEIIFLIDASLSIRDNRLEDFSKAIAYCIKNLNPGDKFNVFIFKDKITRLFAESMEANAFTLNQAKNYLKRLEPSETTDIYEAFLESVETKPAMLPSYIVLLSDGRPTQGITSSAKLIEEISRINRQQRSIFAFTGGRKVNRYLLDFLAYQNRGWSEYALTSPQIPKKGEEFYEKIRHPLLINMRYQFSQLDPTEVYPKYLPDFYRNAAFVLYGTYDQEKQFSVRLVGEIHGEPKELIVSVDLDKAAPGTLKVGRFWAFNKIYYLISKMTMEGENPHMREQIRQLSKKFSITTPYDL